MLLPEQSYNPEVRVDKGAETVEIKKKTEKFSWGDIDTIDIKPKEIKTETPVFFAPGWSITIETLEKPLRELAKYNRRVISLSHLRTGGVEKENEELRKAASLLAILERKNIEKTDMIGYSEGAINLLLLADIAPEKFRNIVLLGPAGLTGKENVIKIATRFTMELLNFLKNASENGSRTLVESLKYIAENPIRSYKEVTEIAQADIFDLMKRVKEKGVGVSIVAGAEDETFFMEKIQAKIKKLGHGEWKNYFDGFYSIKGGHFDFIDESKKYMAGVDNILDDAERKYNKEIEKRSIEQ